MISYNGKNVLFPLIIITAIAIWIESGGKGPVLYFQQRTGLDGDPFNLVKFRKLRAISASAGRACKF